VGYCPITEVPSGRLVQAFRRLRAGIGDEGLGLFEERLAKPARNPTAAPRIVDGADRPEHNPSYPMEVD
jgi:hypothetical protein